MIQSSGVSPFVSGCRMRCVRTREGTRKRARVRSGERAAWAGPPESQRGSLHSSSRRKEGDSPRPGRLSCINRRSGVGRPAHARRLPERWTVAVEVDLAFEGDGERRSVHFGLPVDDTPTPYSVRWPEPVVLEDRKQLLGSCSVATEHGVSRFCTSFCTLTVLLDNKACANRPILQGS